MSNNLDSVLLNLLFFTLKWYNPPNPKGYLTNFKNFKSCNILNDANIMQRVKECDHLSIILTYIFWDFIPGIKSILSTKKYIDQEPTYLMRQICVLQWEEIKTTNSGETHHFEEKGPMGWNINILLLYFPFWPESQKSWAFANLI